MINKKQNINRLNKLSDHFLEQAVNFKTLALSLKQNKVTQDINNFVEKQYNKHICTP